MIKILSARTFTTVTAIALSGNCGEGITKPKTRVKNAF